MTYNSWRNRLVTGISAALAAIILVACGDSAASENAPLKGDKAPDDPRRVTYLPVGEEFQPCDSCPVFVRVPDAPEELRPIKYVAKYPLTWKRYLEPIKEGACPAPSRT